MIQKLMRSIREQKKSSILAMVTISGEVVFEAVSYTHLTLPTKRIV